MNLAKINKTDIANGEGVRVSIFVSGCTHHCDGCFNPETWDFGYGVPYTEATEAEILEALAPSFIAGLTLLGGEPMEPANQRMLLSLLQKVRERYPDKNVWCYSGYTWEMLNGGSDRCVCEATDQILSLIDVLVDGVFVLAQKDIRLKFRGSSNQRVIDVKKTREMGEIVLYLK